jgi:hypothetical protein
MPIPTPAKKKPGNRVTSLDLPPGRWQRFILSFQNY